MTSLLARRTRLLAPTVAALAATLLAIPTSADASILGLTRRTAPAATTAAWAPVGTATITPGVMTYTEGAQCTANFVFTDGADVYLGQAAHCSGTGAATETDGCDSASLPLGTLVEIDGATKPGRLVYNSWLTMQARGENDADTCAYNDFALIRIDPADHGRVNPSVPSFGGPVALGSTTALGDDVYSYGNSSLRFGLSPLSPKQGISLGASAGGWTHTVYTATPGIPGDSGSGFLDADGKAFGVLSTVAIAPLAASNGVSDLALGLAYANAHGQGIGTAVLAPGTEPFSAGLL